MAPQLTRYGYVKILKKLFLLKKLTNYFFRYSKYGLEAIQIDMVIVW